MYTDVRWNNIYNMKGIFFLATLYFMAQFNYGYSENFRYDPRILGCIPILNPDINTVTEYNQIQIVTDLIHVPLREIARRPTVSEKNPNYNRFLTCSWIKYEYQTRHGDIVFDAIERALREALVLEVGSTGPGINLSKVEAKRIVNHCRDIKGVTPGLKVVKVQNCILEEIHHIGQDA